MDWYWNLDQVRKTLKLKNAIILLKEKSAYSIEDGHWFRGGQSNEVIATAKTVYAYRSPVFEKIS